MSREKSKLLFLYLSKQLQFFSKYIGDRKKEEINFRGRGSQLGVFFNTLGFVLLAASDWPSRGSSLPQRKFKQTLSLN